MTSSAGQSASRRPDQLRPASLGTLVALLSAAVGVSYLAALRLGPLISPEVAGTEQAAAWGAASVALGAIVGLLVVLPPSIRMPAKLGMGVLIASGARLLFMLGNALAVLLLLKPAGAALFSAVGIGGAWCIFLEAAWATRFLNRATQARSGALLT